MTEQELYELFIVQEKKQSEIAEMMGVNRWNIRTLLKQYGISAIDRGKDTYKNEEWLREKYWSEELSCAEIAQIVPVDRATIQNWMKHYSIPSRKSGIASAITRRRKWKPNNTFQNRDWLYRHYVELDMTATEIALIVDKSIKTILNWIRKLGIEIKPKSLWVYQQWKEGGIFHSLRYDDSKLYQNESWLREKYEQEKLSLKDMGTLASCEPMTILSWMKKFEIETRSKAGYIEPQIYHDKEWLEQKYWQEKLSTHQIAKLCNTESMTIRRWMIVNDIPRRDKSESSIAAWETGQYDDFMPFGKPTSIEIALSAALDKLEIKHESQFRPKECRYIYDELVYPNIIIEAHGDYWHNYEKRPEQEIRDKEKRKWAADNNFLLIVFWEHEINTIGAEDLINQNVISLLKK